MKSEIMELRYIDLKNDICRQIYEGVYKNGEKIPSERQLAQDYEVSRITVRKALELLEAEELIVREVGNGTWVTLKNYGNHNMLDMIGVAAPSKNPFFARFIADFQKCVWEREGLMLYVEVPEHTSLEDCLYRLYSKNIRNVVVWQDDQKIAPERLLRLRSIGMNLVFFDTDNAFPYADSVFLDNEDAVRSLLDCQKKRHQEYVYVGWDNQGISNVRKREEAFRGLHPEAEVLHAPWRRDRRMSEEALKAVEEKALGMEEGLFLCGTGEIGQQTAERLMQTGILEKGKIALAVIDDFEGSERYPMDIYNQDLGATARRIYRQLEAQAEEGITWKAKDWQVKGNLKRNLK